MTIEYKNIEFFLKKIDHSVNYYENKHLIDSKTARRWFEDVHKAENNIDENGKYIFEDDNGTLLRGNGKDRVYRTDAIEKVISAKKENIQKKYLKNTTLDEEKIKIAKKNNINPQNILINAVPLTEHRIPKIRFDYDSSNRALLDDMEFKMQILQKKQETFKDTVAERFEQLNKLLKNPNSNE
ncbi:hypothetical protein [Marinilactibacillus psychrotolerans]|uniref:hypothetical protein n=1 Tax=Marinilactibacillus psychrotolerans TaxID=191770 RepID=UPI00388A7DB3